LVGNSETVVPDVRLVPPARLTTRMAKSGLPALRWEAVPRAARYRVALRDLGGPVLRQAVILAGSGSPGVDPGEVRSQDKGTGKSLPLPPERLVGPAPDLRRRGLRNGRSYDWYLEALAPEGAVLAMSETLAVPASSPGHSWTALRPPQGTD